MDEYNVFITRLLMKEILENNTERIIIKHGRSYTCIEGNYRFSCGEGKEGKTYKIKDLKEFLSSKKITEYCIIDDSIEDEILLSDKIKKLYFIEVPTKKEYEIIKKNTADSKHKNMIDKNVEVWESRIRKSIEENKYKILSYKLVKNSLDINIKDVKLDILQDNQESYLYISCENKYNTEKIIEMVQKFL